MHWLGLREHESDEEGSTIETNGASIVEKMMQFGAIIRSQSRCQYGFIGDVNLGFDLGLFIAIQVC